MTVELKKGYYIDSYYDKNTRSYITTLKDEDGNQVRDAYYSGNMTDRNADIQYMKEFFNQYMNEALNLRKTIKDTKEKIKKAKLPALSTLSPIMPDAAAGIATFNSGVGLSEDYIGRDELIKRLKAMGYKYNYPKYTDQELYEIYKKSLKAEETKQAFKKLKAAEKARKQRYKDKLSQVKYDEDSDTYSDGSYYKDGIEFESEEAAREYFGESMNNIDTDALKNSLEVILPKICTYRDMSITLLDNGVKLVVYCREAEYEEGDAYALSIWARRLSQKLKGWTVRKEGFITSNINGAGFMFILKPTVVKHQFGESMNNKFYLNDMHKAWDIEEDSSVKTLNENLNSGHEFKTITEGLKYFERKEFNENCRDAELESLYEGIKNNLDQEDIKKLGNFLKKADSADDVATYIRGLLSEDVNNENFNDVTIGLYGGDETFPYPEDFYSFIDKCKKLGITVSNDSCDEYMNWEMDLTGNGYTIYKLCRNFPGYDNVEFSANDWIHEYRIDESLTEARKPKYVDSQFGRHVKDAMDKGELTYNNIKEWDRKYNGGIDPIPAFNTRELMNFYYMRPDYFDESLKEDIHSTALGDIDKEYKMEDNMNSAIGITDILIDAINKKYDSVRDLNSLNVNLEEENYEAMIPVIDSIIEDENNNIGKLQQLIDLLSNSEEDIEEGKQETIEIIDTNEFVESITTMKKKLRLSENFDNVIDDVQAVADPVFVGANEEHDENKKKYEDAMEENKKAAEDTIPDEGDTGKEVKSAALKSMHLSEELFEDLSFDAYDDFNHEVYNAIADVCYKFSDKGLSKKDIEAAIEWFETHFEEDDDFEFETKEEEEIVEESLDSDAQRQLNSDVYNAFGDLAFKYYQKEMPLDKEDFKKAFDSFMFRFFKESDEAQAKGYLWSEEEQGWIDPSLEESLNESFVAEWWGQVDGDTPQEVAERYNLKVKPIKKNLDEILYKFEGKLEDFSKAMDDGYFYALTVQQDAGHSEDIDSLLYESIQTKIAKEQIKRFTEGKMPKDWSVEKFLEKLTEKKHINNREATMLREWYSKLK